MKIFTIAQLIIWLPHHSSMPHNLEKPTSLLFLSLQKIITQKPDMKIEVEICNTDKVMNHTIYNAIIFGIMKVSDGFVC